MATYIHDLFDAPPSGIPWYDLDLVALVDASNFFMDFLLSDGTYLRIFSSNGDFTYDNQGPTGGTVTHVLRQMTPNLFNYESIFNLQIPLVDLFNAPTKADFFNLIMAGADTLTGWSGTDYLLGGPGADALNGGAGSDYADYASATAGVSAALGAGGGFSGDAAGDSYNSIENLRGSQFDDTLSGDDNPNVILGGAGNDWLTGFTDFLNGPGFGGDTIDGGPDVDTVYYGFFWSDPEGGTPGVYVNLATGVGIAPGLNGLPDVLINIENVVGGPGSDTLIGDDGDNILDGGFNLVTIGGPSSDTLFGGGGNDTLIGQNGYDVLDGGTGNDALAGNGGADTFLFATGGGADVVLDFNQSDGDKIDLQGVSNVHSFGQLLTLITQGLPDTVIDFGNGDTLTLTGVNGAVLVPGDFLFNSQGDTPHDFNADGTSDILWYNPSTGDVGQFEMHNGLPTWKAIGGDTLGWQIAGTGDFNGDLTSDILWRHTSSGDIGFYEMNNGVPTWHSIGGASTAWQVAGIGDFNGDLTDDILWHHTSSGDIGFYQMNDGVPTWRFIGGASTAWQVAAIGDYDGDLTSDILWRHTGSGDIGFYEMNDGVPTWHSIGGASTAWLVVA